MASFFSQKHPATIFLTAVCNLIFVNFCFVLTSIPLITIGASLTAMNRITIKILLGENPHVFNEYFRCFKDNFKQSTVLWILLAGIAGFRGDGARLEQPHHPEPFVDSDVKVFHF